MTVKEKVLRMMEKLAEDVTYDQILYHVEVMRRVEEAVEALDRGDAELIDHDEVFRRLEAEDAKGEAPLDGSGSARPGKHQTAHRKGSATNRGKVRKGTPARRRKA